MNFTKRLKTPLQLLGRILVSAILVFATYNPTTYSIYHWTLVELSLMEYMLDNPQLWIVALSLAFLSFLWIYMCHEAYIQLGKLYSVLITMILVFSLLYLYTAFEIAYTVDSVITGIQIIVAGWMGFGLTFSIIKRKTTGAIVTTVNEDNSEVHNHVGN